MSDSTNLKVFISWSGATSKTVAAALRLWLPTLSDYFEPFMSDEDIEPGSRGLNKIAEALLDTDFGIIVVTRDNQNRPWLNYEAGAMSKEVGPDPRARVVPLLVDFDESSTLSGDSPMVQFQYRHMREEDMRNVIKTMARAAGAEEANVLARFDWAWGDLQAKLDAVLAELAAIEATPSAAEPAATQIVSDSNNEVLAEILENTRELVRRSDPPRRLGSGVATLMPVADLDVSPTFMSAKDRKKAYSLLAGMLRPLGFDVRAIQFRTAPDGEHVEAIVFSEAMPDRHVQDLVRTDVIRELGVFPLFRSASADADMEPAADMT